MPKGILENVWKRYLRAAEILGYEDEIIEELTSFKGCHSMDIDATVGGRKKRLNAVRVWHRGPLTDAIRKGGNRYMEGVTLDSLQSHAAEMSTKSWLHELPYAGAKGGIDVDPHKCTPEELEEITYKFVDELNEVNMIGPFRDVPAPDIGTNSLIMFWMAERYKYLHRGEPFVKAVVTGKPVKIENAYVGGIHGRVDATGYGLCIVLDELKKLGCLPKNIHERPIVVIQGFGNVGMHAALYAQRLGHQIIAITDKFGGVYRGVGLDIPALIKYALAQKPTTVAGFPGTEPITNEVLLGLPCDYLLPCALEEVITADNANGVQAKVIIEGANGPTTPEADSILEEKGVMVVPDILANSMGLVVSFFEWAMNTDHKDPRLPKRNEKGTVLGAGEKMMRNAVAGVVERAKKHNVLLRPATYIDALEKAELLRIRRIPSYAAKVLV